ncbi:hypothetical protein C0993_012355 [Termitomyces sp. T159_Od127]|nr:hypothetical protein C0993_012355 [Termitomyces sp. T159_Od127]
MHSKLILTAATGIAPFMDANGEPSSDVAPFAKVLDFIAIMNYDIWGPWSPTVGPNSPLDDSCATPANRIGSATSAIAKWTKAGFPISQLILGVPGHGHSYRVHRSEAYPLTSYPSFDASSPPPGDSWDDAGGVDVCGNVQAQGGNINFWGLIEKGFLNDDGSVKTGISSAYDKCTQTVSHDA